MSLTNVPRGSFLATFLILAGAFLFLSNIGSIPGGRVGAYWPIWLIAPGALILDRRRNVVGAIWALAFTLCAFLIILGNLRIIHVTAEIIGPIMLIALGAILLVRPAHLLQWHVRDREQWQSQLRDWHARFHFQPRNRSYAEFRKGDSAGDFRQGHGSFRAPSSRPANLAGSTLHEAVVFGAINRRMDTQSFEGGRLDVVFGSIELDLSGAAIATVNRRAAINANAAFGGIEIRVPRTWKIVMRSAAVFGGCDDRTVPPRPEAGFTPETLVITGAAVFGGITIRN